MLIRTLTPAVKREIVIADEEIGRVRYGTQHQGHSIAPAASMAMANRATDIREDQKLDLPGFQPATGRRRYDFTTGAYVRDLPALPTPRAPKRTVEPYQVAGGKPFWIIDRETGTRQRRICAQTAHQAQQVAAAFAEANGFEPSACYAEAE